LFPKADFEIKEKYFDAIAQTLSLLLKKKTREALTDESVQEMLRLGLDEARALRQKKGFIVPHETRPQAVLKGLLAQARKCKVDTPVLEKLHIFSRAYAKKI